MKRPQKKQKLFQAVTTFNKLCADAMDYIFSYLRDYLPVLRLVCKEWKSHTSEWDNKRFFRELIKTNNVHLLEYVYRFGRPFSRKLFKYAISHGTVESLEWTKKQHCNWKVKWSLIPANEGRLQMLQWLKGNEYQCDFEVVPLKAARKGHLNILQWIHELNLNPLSRTSYIVEAAARGGHLEILKWLKENDYPWKEQVCALAASGGHLEVLKWLRDSGCPWDEFTCFYAAGNNALEVLDWSRKNGCPWNEHTCAIAAENDNLEMLKWLRENGCPWDERVCFHAVEINNLEMLNWALENGCPYTSNIYDIVLDEC